MNILIKNIRWLGHEGFLINEKPITYINPYKLGFPDIGDLVLITNDQDNHCSPDDIKWIRKGSTIIIGPSECAAKFQGDVRSVKPGDTISAKGASIAILPAFKKGKDNKKEYQGVGFNITFSNGLRVYHTGDTALIPEMQSGMTDILLIPIREDLISLTSEAAEIVNKIKPKIAIPMNWDGKKESISEVEGFVSLCNVNVEILKPKP